MLNACTYAHSRDFDSIGWEPGSAFEKASRLVPVCSQGSSATGDASVHLPRVSASCALIFPDKSKAFALPQVLIPLRQRKLHNAKHALVFNNLLTILNF